MIGNPQLLLHLNIFHMNVHRLILLIYSYYFPPDGITVMLNESKLQVEIRSWDVKKAWISSGLTVSNYTWVFEGLVKLWKIYRLQWLIQDFPPGEHIILPKSPKNCMELKEFGRPGGWGGRRASFTPSGLNKTQSGAWGTKKDDKFISSTSLGKVQKVLLISIRSVKIFWYLQWLSIEKRFVSINK